MMLHQRYKELAKGCGCNASRRRVDDRVERLLLVIAEELPALTNREKPQAGIVSIQHSLDSLEAALIRESLNAIPK